MPDIAGKYTVYAVFDGSESYWPSQATTAFAVDEAHPTATAAPNTDTNSMLNNTSYQAVAAIIIVIIIIGALIMLMLGKDHKQSSITKNNSPFISSFLSYSWKMLTVF